MRSQLVVLGTALSLLSRLVHVLSLVGSDLDFAAPLEDNSVFLLSEPISSPVESNDFDLFQDSSTIQPAVPAFDQAASLFTGEATLAEYLTTNPVSEDGFLLEHSFDQLADSCSGSVNPYANQGISKSRIKRLDVASGFCEDKAGSNGGVDDLDLSKVDPEATDLLKLFRAEREQDFSRAMQDREQNTLCFLLTAGRLPWGVCYGGFVGLDDVSVNSAPMQTPWAFWHTVTISQVTYGMRMIISMHSQIEFQATPIH